MVKKLIVVFLLGYSALFAESQQFVQERSLQSVIKSFIGESRYARNKSFIRVIFSPQSRYYDGSDVRTLKVLRTLKANGLLRLKFSKPKTFHLHFKTQGSALLFVKIMSETLREIGYYRYVTTGSSLEDDTFTWSISINAESMTDPLVLASHLSKNRARVVDVEKASYLDWNYYVDISRASLRVPALIPGKSYEIKRALYPEWFNVAQAGSVSLSSNGGNNWYPYIAFYDRDLQLLQVIKEDNVVRNKSYKITPGAKYMKIGDLYTMKNMKYGLTVTPHSY